MMKEENEAIIKALNIYGRVPETWELLNEIERLNNIIDELEKDTVELMKNFKDINAPRYDMCKHFIYKINELKEGK